MSQKANSKKEAGVYLTAVGRRPLTGYNVETVNGKEKKTKVERGVFYNVTVSLESPLEIVNGDLSDVSKSYVDTMLKIAGDNAKTCSEVSLTGGATGVYKRPTGETNITLDAVLSYLETQSLIKRATGGGGVTASLKSEKAINDLADIYRKRILAEKSLSDTEIVQYFNGLSKLADNAKETKDASKLQEAYDAFIAKYGAGETDETPPADQTDGDGDGDGEAGE